MQRRIFSGVVVMLCSAAITAGTLAVVPQSASADPASVVSYPKRASANRYRGLAFETCTAPSLAAMTAWTASPYRAIGVYVAGVSRSCQQPNLTAAWVSAVSALGWRLMPIYLGLQPPCVIGARPNKIIPSKAAAQGTAAATEAITAVTALGLQPGSIIYADLENYDPTDVPCRTATLTYLSGYTRQLHRRGYLSGAYVNVYSGGMHLAGDYLSTVRARADAIWGARWDGVKSATLPKVPATRWAVHQRAKQYIGPHDETFGGVKINIDTDWLDGPVATVARPQTITASTIARTTPLGTAGSAAGTILTGTQVNVICQAPGASVHGTKVWNKLSTGQYVNDHYLDTPTKPGYSTVLPRCYYPYQVKPSAGTAVRTGAGSTYLKKGTLYAGSLAWLVCQKVAKKKTGTSKVWDQIDSGWYVSDYTVATVSKTSYTAPIPRC